MVKDSKRVNKKMVCSDIEDPEGWTVENNPHPAPPMVRVYPDRDGEHWSDYMEYYGVGKMICHSCLKRVKVGSGNCRDGGPYFICVSEGKRDKLRKEYESKRDVQTTLM